MRVKEPTIELLKEFCLKTKPSPTGFYRVADFYKFLGGEPYILSYYKFKETKDYRILDRIDRRRIPDLHHRKVFIRWIKSVFQPFINSAEIPFIHALITDDAGRVILFRVDLEKIEERGLNGIRSKADR